MLAGGDGNAMVVARVAVARLRPYRGNARTHSSKQMHVCGGRSGRCGPYVLVWHGAEFADVAAPVHQDGLHQVQYVDVEQFGRLPQRRAAHHTLTAAIDVETLLHTHRTSARGHAGAFY